VLSFLTLNIQAAAPARAKLLLAWLERRSEHVLLLTEVSGGPGTVLLLDGFRRAGYTVVYQHDPGGERGAALVSRIPVTPRPDLAAQVSHPTRLAAATLHTVPAVVAVSVYVPSSDRAPEKVTRKRTFLESLVTLLTGLGDDERGRLVLGADLNVVARDHQPRYPGFLAFEYALLEDLDGLGLHDAHDSLSPGAQVYSWFGRGGNGYRFDYVHVGNHLHSHLHSCEYVQEPRELGLSDHAAVTVTLTGIDVPITLDSRLPDEDVLF
jgi:exodeoxyribonuclease III